MSIESIRHASFVLGDEERDREIRNLRDDLSIGNKDIDGVDEALTTILNSINLGMDASVQLDEELGDLINILEAVETLFREVDEEIRDLEWRDPDSPAAQALRRTVRAYNLTMGLEKVARI